MNTTVSGNTATSYGVYLPAAVYAYQSMKLVNSTITNNNYGGVSSPLLIMSNSIVANNAPNTGSCVNSSVIHLGTNIASDATCGDSTVMTIADPVLGPLADNGGPGKTHALLRGALPSMLERAARNRWTSAMWHATRAATSVRSSSRAS